MIYEYFAAEDDLAARKMFEVAWPPPTFRTEVVRPYELDRLEAQLTARSPEAIAADPRFNGSVGVLIAEGEDMVEAGVVTVADPLVRALADTDDAALDALGDEWFGEVPELAAIARHVAARGHHMYSFWML